MEKHKLNFRTTHHQFYIADSRSPFRTDSDAFWTKEASEDKLAVEEGILGVGTECYGAVKSELLLLEKRPDDLDLSACDHAVEGSIGLLSGLLQVFPCTSNDPVLELGLAPAIYRVGVYSYNLASVDGDSGNDFYEVRLWPEPYSGRVVVKRQECG